MLVVDLVGNDYSFPPSPPSLPSYTQVHTTSEMVPAFAKKKDANSCASSAATAMPLPVASVTSGRLLKE